jgi:hypothetical protein
MSKCVIPVFECLLPELHNTKVLRLLFTFCHWHALAKMRMHTDATLKLLDEETTELRRLLRDFESTTCSNFKTRELRRETNARKCCECVKNAATRTPRPGSHQDTARRLKTFNLHTYKLHSLGDYVSTIKCLGTTDSYTTAIVRSISATICLPC